MNKNVLLLIPLGLILSGCSKPDAPPPGNGDPRECTSGGPLLECQHIHADPQISLQRGGMVTTPPNACVKPGETVTFNINPDPNQLDTIEIWPKDEVDTWLAGWNSESSDKIVIKIPPTVTTHTDYDYGWTDHTDGDCVDPRLHVEDQTAHLKEQTVIDMMPEEEPEPATE